MDAIFTNDFDSYLESFSENYKVFTEGERLNNFKNKIIELLKAAKEFIIGIFDKIVNKFKSAFNKDDKLIKQVDEVIKAEYNAGPNGASSKSSAAKSEPDVEVDLDEVKERVANNIMERHKDAAQVIQDTIKSMKKDIDRSNKESEDLLKKCKELINNTGEEPNEQQAKATANKVVRLIKAIPGPTNNSKVLALPVDILKVRWKKFNDIGKVWYINDGIKLPVDDMKEDDLYNEDGTMKPSKEELLKFILNGNTNANEAVRKTFWVDNEYHEYTIKELGGTAKIRSHYENMKENVAAFSKHKDRITHKIDNAMEGFKRESDYLTSRGNKALDKLAGAEETAKRRERDKFLSNCYNTDYVSTAIYKTVQEQACKEALACCEEAYKMCKAALIRIVGGTHNFKESTIDRMVKVAMIETEMCFV